MNKKVIVVKKNYKVKLDYEYDCICSPAWL